MKLPPWSWIVAGWMALLAATAVTVTICVRNAPAPIPLDTPQSPGANDAPAPAPAKSPESPEKTSHAR